MRLCLDEHYSPKIADQLRHKGHDAYAVAERPELRTLSDRDLWSHLQSERRALLTEDVADFIAFVHEAAAVGDDQWGLVFSSSSSLRRAKNTLGAFVQRLDELLSANTDEADFRNRLHWLS